MNKSLIGAILTALGCSLCCIGPVVLVAFGVTSVGLFSFIEPLRPYLIVISVGMLSFTYYRVFKKKSDCCEPDNKNLKVQKLFLFLMTPIILGLIVYPQFIPNEQLLLQEIDNNETFSEWTVTGMTCQGCANGLQNAMANMNGIIKCNVDYSTQTMICKTNPLKISDEKIVELVTNTGYKAIKKSDS